MKKFRFSLETLHFLRKEEEYERKIILARAVGELVHIDKCIEQTWLAVEEAFSRPATSLEALQGRERILIKALNDREKLQNKRSSAALKVDETRQHYVEALAQRKSLDRLKEKRFEQWKKVARRREINFLDEVAKNGAGYEE